MTVFYVGKCISCCLKGRTSADIRLFELKQLLRDFRGCMAFACIPIIVAPYSGHFRFPLTYSYLCEANLSPLL